ncbi:MAG: hypothetical protein ACYTFT_05570 [Planctomycetota bacterium]
MRPINQKIMNQVFEITDAIPMSREAIRIPLAMMGEGGITKAANGCFEITLPDTDDLTPFLSGLTARLRELGVQEAPPTPDGA